MLYPPFLLMEIGEVKIRTTNPKLFANVRSLAFSRCVVHLRGISLKLRVEVP
jgi:hypothetical protein